jgi:hypothetical protein
LIFTVALFVGICELHLAPRGKLHRNLWHNEGLSGLSLQVHTSSEAEKRTLQLAAT